jgi:hypothetical protein
VHQSEVREMLFRFASDYDDIAEDTKKAVV